MTERSDDERLRREFEKVMNRPGMIPTRGLFPRLTFDQVQVLCYGALWRIFIGVGVLLIMWRFL